MFSTLIRDCSGRFLKTCLAHNTVAAVRSEIELAAAKDIALMDELRTKEQAASALQQPLGDALQKWRHVSEKITDISGLVKTFEAFEHPEAVTKDGPTVHLYKLTLSHPGLAFAKVHKEFAVKFVDLKTAELVTIEAEIKSLILDEGKHLVHLLLVELNHLAMKSSCLIVTD